MSPDPSQPLNVLKTKKYHGKIFGLLIVVPIFLLTLGLSVSMAWQTYKDVTGYKCFGHSFGKNCEYPAKDAGKVCTYNDECSSRMCIYAMPPGSGTLGGYILGQDAKLKISPDFGKQGFCDKYGGDNDGVTQCTHERGKEVECSEWVSYGLFAPIQKT